MPPALLVIALLASAIGSSIATETTQWPSLRFHFTLKRSSMKAFGQSEFDMFANPIVSGKKDKVLYDVYATFTEGTTLYNYTLIESVAHSSSTPYSGNPADDSKATPTVTCLDSEAVKLPAINAIVSAINGATAVSGTSDKSINCSSGSLFKVTVNGIDFALCASGSTGFTMQGTDMDITVEFLESAIDIQTPTTTAKGGECMKVASASSITSIGKSLLTGQSVPKHERSLKAAFEFSFRDEPTCTCKSKPRPCIFIHGLGVKQEVAENQDWFSYWASPSRATRRAALQ